MTGASIGEDVSAFDPSRKKHEGQAIPVKSLVTYSIEYLPKGLTPKSAQAP